MAVAWDLILAYKAIVMPQMKSGKLPFPEEFDILREEFYNLEEFYICDLYGS